MSDNTVDKKGILLETGTNEFEIVEFNIGKVSYGINVAKVREVINRDSVTVTKMPQVHPFVDGLFTLRGRVMPLVNLPRCLNEGGEIEPKNIIVTEINNYNMGFLVDTVSRIHRISWTEMEPAPNVGDTSMVVGVIKMSDKIVLLLDFEKIIAEINPEINAKLTTFEDTHDDIKEKRTKQPIVVAEDSPMLRDLLVGTLHEAGYRNVHEYSNGKLAWEALSRISREDKPVSESVKMIISDIEMPQMDGHHLLTLVRADQRLKEVPLVFFSSLINDEMRRKGESIGANGQISKPEIAQLIDLIDTLIFGKHD
ncbi:MULTISPECIES: chemotaxis protein [Anaerosinus]|uniref:Chemotaxis protein n=1 Tax=Selenobaculum gibii TaxID=3054208 RepID=A0A9Y2AJB8_9FIRM|nr:chemotaxis protein [Selenobaculum gbiensis]WIW71427.1 chemotaxis protein [Selenobaculum gbiensis]